MLKAKGLAALFAMTVAAGQAAAQDIPKVMNLGTHGVGSLIYAMGIGIGKVVGSNLDVQVRVQPGAGPAQWLPQIASGETQLPGLGHAHRRARDRAAAALSPLPS